MDLIQSNGQPHYGRFSILPTRIDFEKYHYTNPAGELLTGWRKRLKYKKFKFCSIQHEDYTICMAIADLAWAGHGLVYVYQHSTGQVLAWQGSNFLARHTRLDEQPLFNHSAFQKSPFRLVIEHANGVRYLCVTKHGEVKLSARIFCAGTDPLSVCSPTDTGWSYTQKLTSLGCEGFFLNKQGQTVHFNAKSFASLEDTCGFIPAEAAWCWLSCNFWDQHNNRIGLNLSSALHTGNHENCLWVNGVLYPLPELQFSLRHEQQWQVRSLDGSVMLSFELKWARIERMNFRFTASHCSQWQVSVTGIVQQGEHCIELNQEYGLFEQHLPKKADSV
jgi:hypothetical protein